jgi:hypothetical protein
MDQKKGFFLSCRVRSMLSFFYDDDDDDDDDDEDDDDHYAGVLASQNGI